MMILKENEVCPFSKQCPYNINFDCFGSIPNRKTVFTCNYVKNGKILEGQGIRLPGDKTGNMRVIME
jgi:hypothetical protein